MHLHDHVPLREVSWFHTGGVSEYYVACQTLREVIEAVSQANALKVPFRVIGEGSNLLMSDGGYPGIIIQNRAQSLVFLHERSQVIVDAGMPLATLVSRTLSLGYSGLEFLTGIPGTVGGAVYGNTTAFGLSIGDYVRSATLLFPSHRVSGEEAIRRVDRDWFSFHFRSSKLKDIRYRDDSLEVPVILSITLQLSKMSPSTCLQKVKEYSKKRFVTPTQPSLQVFDSLFFSPPNETESGSRLRPDQMVYLVPKRNVRDWRSNDITIFAKNPNYIVNAAIGTSRDAQNVIEAIQHDLDVSTPPLVEYVGLWEGVSGRLDDQAVV